MNNEDYPLRYRLLALAAALMTPISMGHFVPNHSAVAVMTLVSVVTVLVGRRRWPIELGVLGMALLAGRYTGDLLLALVMGSAYFAVVYVVGEPIIRRRMDEFLASREADRQRQIEAADAAARDSLPSYAQPAPPAPGPAPRNATLPPPAERRTFSAATHGFAERQRIFRNPDIVRGNFRSWGVPGAGLESSGFGDDLIRAGQIGEQSTMEWLADAFADFPYEVGLVNSVTFAGSKNADVDHVLICGKHAWLIDSKNWARGRYNLIDPDLIFLMKLDRNGSYTDDPTETRDIHMNAALANQRNDVPEHYGWTFHGAYVVIHPYHTDYASLVRGLSSPGFIVESATKGEVTMCTIQGLVDDLKPKMIELMQAETNPVRQQFDRDLAEWMIARMKV